MFVKLSKNSFVRYFDDKVYVTNQVTQNEIFLNETALVFMHAINRTPITIDKIENLAMGVYGDSVTQETLRSELTAFLNYMIKEKYLVQGESISEIDQNDKSFSYTNYNLSTFQRRKTGYAISDNYRDSLQYMNELSHEKPRLMGLQFEITGRCNERCIHCYIPNFQKDCGTDIPTQDIFRVIDEFADMGGLGVTLSGGEAFMHKDIIPIIKYCRQKDLQISILSNLVALQDSYIQDLQEANISVIQVSLYSMKPQIHDKITKHKGSFQKTINSIEKLVAADIPIQIACPVMKENYKDYKDVLKYAESLACRVQSDFIMMAQSDLDTSNLSHRLSLDETKEIIKDIIKWDTNYRSWLVFSKQNALEIKKQNILDTFCAVGRHDLCISSNGDVYPCAGWQGMVVGNIYNCSLQSIWLNSTKLNAIRSIKLSNFPKCTKCLAKDFCSPCLMRNYNENNGDMFAIATHFCSVAFLTKQLVEEYFEKNKNVEETENPLTE